MATKLQLAQSYHSLGLNVLPIGAEKRPIVDTWDRWKHERQTADDVGAFAWDDAKGIGVIAGPVSEHLVNIDADRCTDVAVLQELLDFLWLPSDYPWAVRTGHGFQVWVRCPDLEADAGVLKAPYEGTDHLELRWNECYSVVPPSRHPSGKHYTFLYAQGVPSELPAEVAAEDLLVMAEWGARIDGTGEKRYDPPAAEAVKEAVMHFRTSGDEAMIEVAVRALEKTEKGERNASLYHLALALAYAGVLDRWAERLTLASERSGLRPREVDRSICSARGRAQRKREAKETPVETPMTPGEALQGIVTLRSALSQVKHYTRHPLPRGIDFPWSRVTWMTRGLRPGWLCYLAGYTSMGKTAAAIEITVTAARSGKRVLFVSCEMSPDEIGVRVAQRWGLSGRRFYAGRAGVDDERAVDRALEVEAYDWVGIAYTRQMADIEAMAAAYDPGLLVVDYLQFLDIGRESRQEGTTRNSHALKDIARRLEIPVLCLSQLRRADRSQRFATPALDDLRDSGSVEQDADQVIFVHREREEQTRTVLPNGEFVVAKARMGEQGSVKFTFDGGAQTFRVLDSEHEVAA
jgi:replicative DNA helicase